MIGSWSSTWLEAGQEAWARAQVGMAMQDGLATQVSMAAQDRTAPQLGTAAWARGLQYRLGRAGRAGSWRGESGPWRG